MIGNNHNLLRVSRRTLVAVALGWGLSCPASAISVIAAPRDASIADLTGVIVADGVVADRLAGQARSLLTLGVSPGNVVQALLTAGYGTFDVVRDVMVQGVLAAVGIQADALVREVAFRVFFVQGPTVRVIVHDAVLAARQILLDLGKLPAYGEGTRFFRTGVALEVLIDEALAAAVAAGTDGQTWQVETAPGGEASRR